ncbi:MAG: YceI family protein [Bacteroidales bacterium]|nr:YceI family protein [Bacteroidales bacterium]
MNLYIRVAFLLLISLPLFSQNKLAVELQKNSSLTIHGSTNVIPFKLIQNGDKLSRKEMFITVGKTQNKWMLSQNTLAVNVKGFTSDNRMALRDFQKLMKADQFPQLQVQVISLEMLPIVEKSLCYNGNAVLNITITNVTKQYVVPFTAVCEGDLVIADGKKKISIKDFSLTPPVQMMGLIRVSEWINVDFHLICKITEEKAVK